MNKVNWGVIVVLVLVVGAALVTGCNFNTLKIGELQANSSTIELGSADEVTTEIKMGAGKLAIRGGSAELLDAQFTYNVAAWKPEVSYEISDGIGRLSIEHPNTDEGFSLNLDEIRYEWDLQLNEDVPMDLVVTLGAGESRLALNSLLLNKFEFESGAGDVEIDLSGSTVRDMDVSLGAGDVEIDLSGDWQQNLTANVKGGLGRATVILPTTAGVRVKVQSGLGQVNASGLNRDGAVYTNDAYGQADVTLDIDIQGGVGEINLKFAE